MEHRPTERQEWASPTVVVQAGPGRGAWWLIALSLAVIATTLVIRLDERLTPSASAQNFSGAGSRGVFAFPAQLTSTSSGVYMVDVDTGTIWCYEFVGATRHLRLVAGRSWRYDRYLRNWGCDDPSPAAVERMLETERAAKLEDLETEEE